MSIFDDIKQRLISEIDDLSKSDADNIAESPMVQPDNSSNIGRKAIIDDPYFENTNQHYLYKHKMSRISNRTLKEVSVRDWLVSAIIQARVDTLLRFSRVQPSDRRFDMGFRVIKRDGTEDFTEADREEIAQLEDFIYNCGRTKNTPMEDRMYFGEFIKLIVRDALTFGHVAIEKVLTRKQALHRFRPLPAESVYLINKQSSKEMVEKEMAQAQAL
jgi:hypothetical protein